MTELPALRAMLNDTAERRYPRRRKRRLLAATVAATVAATAVALLLWRPSTEPEREVLSPPPATTPTSNTRVETLDVDKLRDTPAVIDDLSSGGELARAWSVPTLRGDVHLIRKPAEWCLSVPDPLTDQPNLERGKACTSATAFASNGITIGIGDSTISLAGTANAPLIVTVAGQRRSTPPSPDVTPPPTPSRP